MHVKGKNMKKALFAFASVLLSISSSVHAFESAPSLIFVGSTYSGHEEITRQALKNISKKIKEIDSGSTLFELDDLKFDLAPEAKGLFGYKSKNMVIHGNFSSDFPKQTSVMSLGDFWNIKNFSEFENPDTQMLHFLKNYTNSITLASARSTCEQARAAIKKVTTEALKSWNSNNKTRALFLLGHATHTIQDSFSRAHTQRAGDENNNDLINICYYGSVMNKKMDHTRRGPKDLCFHSSPDSKDAVWNLSGDQYKKALSNWASEAASQCDKGSDYPQTDEQKSACLSDEARLARVATEKYLFLVFNQIAPQNLLNKSTEDFVAALDSSLFDGPVGDAELDRKMPNGILRCDSLPTNEITGSEPPAQGKIGQ